ncbi:MAG TPA: EamA family transporter [Steroidobacteraceae bacterium]|nr:EamA family transporter [Steroidobacteraceae bacterium]
MQFTWLLIAIVSTFGYHLVIKLTPGTVNPLVSLAVTYAAVTVLFSVAAILVPDSAPLRESLRQVNWTALALAVTIIGLDLGFLLLYRSGFEVSLGQIVTQSAAALLLIGVGVAVFRERLTATNVAGIALCIAGLWLISRR